MREVSEEEKMQATLVALEGRALSWFQWWERCNPSPSWESFKLAVVRRFQPSMIQNPFELLLSLKQVGTVDEYVEEFDRYARALKEIDHDSVRGIFLNGLKDEIKAEVRLFELGTLAEVIQKALLIEQRNLIVTKKGGPWFPRSFNSYKSNSYSKVVTVEPQASSNSDHKSEGSFVGSGGITSKNQTGAESLRSRGSEFKRFDWGRDERKEGKELVLPM